MDLKRFFTDTIIDDKAYLYGQEFYHATKVVRLKKGYKLIICNNSGLDHYCTVEEITNEHLLAKIDKTVSNDTELTYKLDLYIGINKDIDTVIQKAVELGVTKIIPFTSQHGNFSSVNKERLNKIILESAKQCGRAVLPHIGETISFDEINSDKEDILCFYEFERSNKVSDIKILNKNIGIVIGPEGGFSQEEYEVMRTKGFHILTLGKRILRVSTAVVSAITLVNEHMGEI